MGNSSDIEPTNLPPIIESETLPPILEKKRYHDLDALRACAMLLGIVLHAILAFGQPGWPGYAPQNDAHWMVPSVVSEAANAAGTKAPEKFSPYKLCFTAIHGFRMQLFFLVSGFFTVMLWRNRGMKELLIHRAKRILLPLAIFTPIAWITMLAGLGIGALGAKVFFDGKGDIRAATERSVNSITDAVVVGDLDAVKGHLKRGSNIEQTNEKGETLLHIAAFFAYPEVVQFLLDKGVDPALKSNKGQTALNYVEGPWNRKLGDIYKSIGKSLGLDLDLDRIKTDRFKCAEILRKQVSSGLHSASVGEVSESKGPLKKFEYRVYYQRFTSLPDFDKLTPEFSGQSEKGVIDLGLAKREETFGMVFEGELEIKEAGDFKFRLGSDDGSRLLINGQELIDNDGMHAVKYKEGSIELEPGEVKIRVEYFDSGGAQGLSLIVSGPSVDEIKLSKNIRDFEGSDWGEWDKGDFNQMVMKQLPEWLQAVLGIGMVAAMAPMFNHLWFLYYLIWLVLGFALVVWIAKKFKLSAMPGWITTSSLRWLWLVPLTFVPQFFMGQSFGPDTAGGVLPWPPVLLYYGIFFGVGVLCHGHDEFDHKVGKLWPLSFLLAIPFLILGVCFMEARNAAAAGDFKSNASQIWYDHFWVSLCASIYVWLMIFGFIGFFRAFFSNQSKLARYISDSSYWLYLAHLAPLMCLQVMFAKLEVPGLLKFIAYCVSTTVVLLVMYEFLVRYTFVGTLLNGKRTREATTA